MSSAQGIVPLIPLIAGALGLLCTWPAFRAARMKRFLRDTPTSKAKGVFMGHVEVKGRIECSRPLTSALAEIPCVWYAWSVGEHWKRTVVESYVDAKGVSRTRTRVETGTTTVASGGEMRPFDVRDETGAVLVQPAGANVEPASVFSRTCDRSDPLYYGKGPDGAVANSVHRRTFSETALPVKHPVFVAGTARERRDVVAPEIAAARDQRIFLISTRAEESIGRGYAWSFWIWSFFGTVIALIPYLLYAAHAGDSTEARVAISVAIVVGYLAFNALVWAWMAFNSIVALRQRVRQAAANVEVQLKRRHDLFPRLVAVVGGIRAHEADVQRLVALLRTQATVGAADRRLAGVAPAIAAIAERYPDLVAHEGFLELQREIADTETRIALARSYYNGIATAFNARLAVVPDRFLAAVARLREFPLMGAVRQGEP